MFGILSILNFGVTFCAYIGISCILSVPDIIHNVGIILGIRVVGIVDTFLDGCIHCDVDIMVFISICSVEIILDSDCFVGIVNT